MLDARASFVRILTEFYKTRFNGCAYVKYCGLRFYTDLKFIKPKIIDKTQNRRYNLDTDLIRKVRLTAKERILTVNNGIPASIPLL